MNPSSLVQSKRFYQVVTVVMCLFIGGGALFDVAKSADAVKLITGLGYPTYLVQFLGVMKLLGVAALLVPGHPRLKQWAYAGLTFDTGGALYSHLRSHSQASKWVPALLGLMLVLGSFWLYTTVIESHESKRGLT
jgi:DoxX-like family